jgi:hypothetical protein
MPPRVLLVTLAVGEKYLEEYNRLFRKSQEQYARSHGYDFRVVTDYLDTDTANHVKSAISFNKILVCSQEWSKKYHYIVFVDADILIRPGSPAIHKLCVGCTEVGIIDEFSQPTSEIRLDIQKRMGWEQTASDYYALCDFDIKTKHVLNTGVLVMQPAKHAALLERIYRTYVGKSLDHPRGFHFEQSAIGYELMKNNAYYILPNKFNAVWGIYRIFRTMARSPGLTLEVFYNDNYMTHFAGRVDIDKVESLGGTRAT